MGEYAGVAGILWEQLDVNWKRHVGILVSGNRRKEAGATSNSIWERVIVCT
jgi:hypothetical protein